MSAAPQLPYDAESNLPRKRFTRREIERLLDLGAFEGQRYELIDGELFDKMGQKPRHASTIARLNAVLGRIYAPERLRIQVPIEAGGPDREFSMPEPDAAVLRKSTPEYDDRHPTGEELILAVEVGDRSAAFDLSRKAQIYATAGVRDYWVVDLRRCVIVKHSSPRHAGYDLVQSFHAGDTLPLPGCSEVVAVNDILPSAE